MTSAQEINLKSSASGTGADRAAAGGIPKVPDDLFSKITKKKN
jgi:hypothetical protein